MPEETIQVLTGDCTVRFESGDDPTREERGSVIALVKPDGTVLVHDRDGYRPAAWLTQAEAVTTLSENGRVVIDAVEGDRRLVVTGHDGRELEGHPVSGVGDPVGTCPSCEDQLVRTPTTLECLGCGSRHGIPRDADLLDEPCETCGLPRMRVNRGATFDLCVDRNCEPLDDRVRDRFDAAWDCPACGSPLRVLRRGGLIAGCDGYPDCETGFAIPEGLVDGTCDSCGLPTFESPAGRRCLDATCAGSG